MRRLPFLSLLTVTLVSTGCGVYLHDTNNQTKAESALKDFQAFRDKSGNPYAVMLKNLEKAKAATADAQRAAADRRVTGYALGLPYKTWGNLRAEVNSQTSELTTAEREVDRAISELATDLNVAQDTRADTKATLAQAKTAVAGQFNRNQRWVAQQALFKQAIQKLAQLSTDKQSDVTIEALEKAGGELLDTEVTVLEQNAKGEVNAVKRKIRDAIGVDLPKNVTSFAGLVKDLSNVKLETESPGIALTILGLAVDLADLEYRKAQVRIANLERRAVLLELLKRNIDDSKSGLKVVDGDLSSFPADEVILHYLEQQRAAKSAEHVGAALRTLARAAILTTVLGSERLRLQVEQAALAHEYSLQLSALNARAHEALIGRGLEGLAAYHRGGLTPEEIANFIRAAQVVALGVIGGRL